MIFAVGMDVLRLYVYFEPARAIPAHIRLIHMDQNAWELGKNYPTEVGIYGNPKPGLEELTAALARP